MRFPPLRREAFFYQMRPLELIVGISAIIPLSILGPLDSEIKSLLEVSQGCGFNLSIFPIRVQETRVEPEGWGRG